MVLGDNHITTYSSAIALTSALHFGETISSASALLFFGQLPTSV